MSVPEAAVEAMARHYEERIGVKPNDAWIRELIEAAAPHMLKDMRPLTLVEIASRNRPEQMEAARAAVRAARRESTVEQLRAAAEVAWNEGYDRGDYNATHAALELQPHDFTNPYGNTL